MLQCCAVLVATAALVAAGGDAQVRHETIGGLSAPAQSFTMTREKFRAGARPFAHTRELLAALAAGKGEFEVKEWFDHNDAKVWKLDSFEDTRDKAYYSTLTTYTLHPDVNYVNYDDHAAAAGSYVKSRSSRHLEHCAKTPEANTLRSVVEGGAALVASSGAWSRERKEGAEEQQSTQELAFSHRVLTVSHAVDSASGHHCSRAELEPLHPWELFSNVNVQALVEHPFDTVMVPADEDQAKESQETDQRKDGHRDLQMAVPDLPLLQCSNPEYSDIGSGLTDLSIVSGNSVKMNKNKGCAIYQKDIPGSFAANFNPGTQRAAQPYTWGVITCDGCFAVLGAGVMLVVNYKATWHFSLNHMLDLQFLAQMKFAGNAGASISLKGVAGSVSASRQFDMPNFAGANAKIPLGSTGIVLTLSWGGASLKMAGSADFDGAFSVAYGQLGSLAVSGMYVGGWKYFSRPSWRSLNQPWTNDGFRCTRWAVNTEVIARESMQLSYGGAIYANFDVFLGATATMSGGAPGAPSKFSNLQLSLAEASLQNAAARSLTAAAASAGADPAAGTVALVPASVLRPGDVLSITHDYADLHAGDEMELYYTLQSLSTGNEYPVLNKKIVVGPGGLGSVSAEWVVPSDLDFSEIGQVLESSFGGEVPTSLKDPAARTKVQGQDGQFASGGNKAPGDADTYESARGVVGSGFVLRVRSDYYGDNEMATSDPVSFAMFTATPDDGIFTSPAAQAHLPVDKAVKVSWSAAHLRRFEPGMHSWTGHSLQTAEVNLDLVMERLDEAGSAVEWSASAPLLRGVANSGRASVVFPSKATIGFDRFYLVVSDARKVQVQGWSKGYFTLAAGSSSGGSSGGSKRTDVIRKLLAAGPAPAEHKLSSHPALAARRLLASAEATRLLTFDPRLLQDQESRALFGTGRVDRPTIYAAGAAAAAATAATAASAAAGSAAASAAVSAGADSEAKAAVPHDWWKAVLASAAEPRTIPAPASKTGARAGAAAAASHTAPVAGRLPAAASAKGERVRVLQTNTPAATACGTAPAVAQAGSAGAASGSQITVPWTLTIFGGGGITSVGLSIKVLSYEKSLNLEGRGNIVSLAGVLKLPAKLSAAINALNSGSFGNKGNCPVCPSGQYRNDALQCVACPKGQVLVADERLLQMYGQRLLQGTASSKFAGAGRQVVNSLKLGRAGDMQSTCFPKAQAQACPEGQVLAPPTQARFLQQASGSKSRNISNGWVCKPCPNGVCPGGNGDNGAAISTATPWPAGCPQPTVPDCSRHGLGAGRVSCEAANKLTLTKARAACSVGLNGPNNCGPLSGSARAACIAKNLGSAACANPAGGMVSAACDCASRATAADKATCTASTVVGIVCDKQSDPRRQELCNKAKGCIGMTGKQLGACAASAAGLAACNMIVKDPTALEACKAAANCVQGGTVRQTATCAGQNAATAVCNGKLTGTAQTGCTAAAQCIGLTGDALKQCAQQAAATTGTAACQNNVQNAALQRGCTAAAQCAGQALNKATQKQCLTDAACSMLPGGAPVQQGCSAAIGCRTAPPGQRAQCLSAAAATACSAITQPNLLTGCQKGVQCATATNIKACVGNAAVSAACATLTGPAQQGCQQGLACVAASNKGQCLAQAGRTACQALSGQAQQLCLQGAQCATAASPANCLRSAAATACSANASGSMQQACQKIAPSSNRRGASIKPPPRPRPCRAGKKCASPALRGAFDADAADADAAADVEAEAESESVQEHRALARSKSNTSAAAAASASAAEPSAEDITAGYDALVTALATTQGLEALLLADGAARSVDEGLAYAQLARGFGAVTDIHWVLHGAGVEGA